MIELTVFGLTDDKTALLMSDPDGTSFLLPLDHRLRTLVDQSRPSRTVEAVIETQLRPRDIQVRVRAGESADEIASSTGVALAKVLPYAIPVLDERRHLAESALKSAVRGGEAGVLADVVRIRLRPAGVRLDDVEWDAWRREDGRWTVRATYFIDTDEQQADFVYDTKGRYVLPDDAIARWLIGAGPARGPAVAPPGQDELDLGIEDTSATPRRALRAVTDLPIERPAADADWMVAAPAPRPRTTEADAAGASAPTTTAADTGSTADDEPPAKPLRGRVKGRASVPTWDEIMFGAGDRI